jgi:hypothetical protein
VTPQIGVISEPAYVVGTATIGSRAVSATAFASPTAEPPPIATRQSASLSAAWRLACSATSTGTWGVTPTIEPLPSAASRRAAAAAS